MLVPVVTACWAAAASEKQIQYRSCGDEYPARGSVSCLLSAEQHAVLRAIGVRIADRHVESGGRLEAASSKHVQA